MPDLSVIMPARNASGTILRAVRSTLRAMPRDAELVVLDDGSTDDTLQLLHGVDDPRLVVLHNDEGHGVAAGLRLLLESTDSRVVGRMDADDVTLPGRFRVQETALRRGADVAFAAVVRFGDRLRELRPTSPLRLGADALALGLLMTNPVSHPTLYARREALDAVGGYGDCIAEDYELWLRLAANGARMVRTRRPVLGYYRHPGQTSGAAGWTETALAEEPMQVAYDALSTRLLGVTRDDEAAFLAGLGTAVGRTSGTEGRWLRHRLRTTTVVGQMVELRRLRPAS
jgi:glycosyltransferase involved in cell wall biosynthesis